MDQELWKWRERSEYDIRKAMRNPDDLDAIQHGTKGMPIILQKKASNTAAAAAASALMIVNNDGTLISDENTVDF